MADERIFAKTPKGAAEITARGGGLSLAQRRLLILVDGVRSIDQLAPVLPPDYGRLLQSLEAAGYVTQVAQSNDPAPAVELLPPAPIPQSEMTSVHEAKLRAVRGLNDLLGPSADALAIAIEGAANGDELRPLIREAERLIASLHGAVTAQAFIVSIRRR